MSPSAAALQHRLEHRGIAPPDDESTADRFPVLWDFLTTSDLGRKEARVPSDFVVSRVPGAYRVTFRDHASFQQKRFIVYTLETILDDIEDALKDHSIPWEEYKSFIATDPAKKKRDNS